MEQIPSLSFVAAASALALEKREMNDDSKLSSPSINIGENPPEVMDSVIKQLQASNTHANQVMNAVKPSGITAFDFLRMPFGQLNQLVMVAELEGMKRETRASLNTQSQPLRPIFHTDQPEELLPKRFARKTLKAMEAEEEEFKPPSAKKKPIPSDNIIESTGERTNVIKRHGSWSHEEDQKLLNHVRETNGRDWKAAAREFPGKTASQCAQRWRRVLNPALNKGPISFAEEKQIMDLKGRDLGWAAIGMKMKRVDLTIRYWWRKFKASHKTPFNQKEDGALLEAIEKFGTDFDVVYDHLKNIKVCPPSLLARTPFSWALRYQTLSGKELALPKLPSLEEDKVEKPLKSDAPRGKRRSLKLSKPAAVGKSPKRKTRSSSHDTDDEDENVAGSAEEEASGEPKADEADDDNDDCTADGEEAEPTKKPKLAEQAEN